MSDDNVTPINRGKDLDNIQEYTRVEGRPYTGPTDAIADVLKLNHFDEAAKNKGWIQLTIIAKFGDEGCMFHTVDARHVALQVKAPGLTTLRLMAADNGLDRDHFAKVAVESELNLLDEDLKDATPEQLQALACGEQDDVDAVIVVLGCQRAAKVLSNIFRRGS